LRFQSILGLLARLPNSLVYAPVEDWNNDDVWLFLMQVKNPWGHDNKSLLGMYQGATEGGECPLVVDSSTPSCGSSRFGCWVCTVVDKDRSMEAMIKNDEEKVWMTPLLELRNELAEPDKDKRDFRRMNGSIQLWRDGTVPGPYKKEAREHWLRRVLEAQQSARLNGPPEFRQIQLISLEELDEIRRLWLHEKHEFDDSLPRIYKEVTGEPFPRPREEGNTLRSDDWDLLREVCEGDEVLFDLQVALLGVEQKFRGMTRRHGVIDALERCLKAAIFEDEEEAVGILTKRDQQLKSLKGQDEDDQRRQLVLFREDRTNDGRVPSGRPE
jgi:DNA sulfur modification protein DndC